MPRARNPLSNRNRNATFTGAEVARAVERLGASKRAKIVREARDFDIADLRAIVKSPFIPPAAYSWSIEQIVQARDQQIAGRFKLPARLAESMGTDDAIHTARNVRLAPVQSLSVEIDAGRGLKADTIANEADALFGTRGLAVSSETITTIRAHLADHGVAFGCITWRPRADGSRLDPVLNAWPIEFVFWHAIQGCYYTQVRVLDEEPSDPPLGGQWMPSASMGYQPLEPILHGDGRWIVFSKAEILPHRLDAALLPASLVWARHAFAMRDWSKGSATHGNPKVVGELPPEVALSDSAGNLTAEAAGFLQLVQAVASHDMPVGIRPPGSKIEYVTNPSRAWEVWAELADRAEKAAARIYLGTDGILGAQGGAPGVDVQALFGVATSKVQSDIAAIEHGIQTGLISPWCALNFGDDKQAPVRRYVFPDPDQAAVRDDFSKRNAAYLAAVKAARDAQLQVTPEWLAQCAKEYGVPAMGLAAAPAGVPTAPQTTPPQPGAP